MHSAEERKCLFGLLPVRCRLPTLSAETELGKNSKRIQRELRDGTRLRTPILTGLLAILDVLLQSLVCRTAIIYTVRLLGMLLHVRHVAGSRGVLGCERGNEIRRMQVVRRTAAMNQLQNGQNVCR